MSRTEHEIVIDETTYKWVHDSCRCGMHCYSDEFYVDGEFYGKIDNPELCSFVTRLIEEVPKEDPCIAYKNSCKHLEEYLAKELAEVHEENPNEDHGWTSWVIMAIEKRCDKVENKAYEEGLEDRYDVGQGKCQKIS